MQYNTTLQTLDLAGMEQGQFMTIVITQIPAAAGNCVLEFKNAGDSNWTTDPSFNGTVASQAVIQRVKCLSAMTRIRFVGAPDSAYWLSIVYDAVPQF